MEVLKLFAQSNETSTLRAVVRRSTLLIVEEKLNDGLWWYMVCNDFEGWVKINPEVRQNISSNRCRILGAVILYNSLLFSWSTNT